MDRQDRELSALRKEVLVARSSILRLKIRHQAGALREGLTWRRAGAAVAASPAGRDALFLLAAEGLGRGRVARWLAWAGRALAVARLANAALASLRERRSP